MVPIQETVHSLEQKQLSCREYCRFIFTVLHKIIILKTFAKHFQECAFCTFNCDDLMMNILPIFCGLCGLCTQRYHQNIIRKILKRQDLCEQHRPTRYALPTLALSDVSWSVQSSLRDEGTSGVATRARHHRHQGLGGPRSEVRIHAHQAGRMVSIFIR